MTISTNVSVQDVRNALNDVPQTVVADDVIQQAIDNAEVIAGAEADDDISSDRLAVAVIDIAAYRVASGNRDLFVSEKSALDLEKSVDVSDWIDSLEIAQEKAVSDLSNTSVPDLHTLGDRRGTKSR